MSVLMPIILSGGSGSHLWPLSRQHCPKQFIKLVDPQHSLLQSTLLRLKQFQLPIVICNQEHRFSIAEQLKSINVKPLSILLEPVSRNTAPAIITAVIHALEVDPDVMVGVFPSDHIIKDEQTFKRTINQAIDAAKDDYIVTFGVVPSRAETDYGYIEANQPEGFVRKVRQFIEKPSLDAVQRFIQSRNHFWNSGMLVFRARQFLEACEAVEPEIYRNCKRALKEAKFDLDFIRLDKEAFESCDDISVESALLQKVDNLMVVPTDAGWSDIDDWKSLWEAGDKDSQNNVLRGDVIAVDSENILSIGYRSKVVGLIGLDNIVIVDTNDALLVANRDRVCQVKNIIKILEEKQRKEHLWHSEVFRPWGSFESLDSGNRFQVKHIKVKPGASLSLQLHHHRAEHWIVVRGSALVQIGDKKQMLTENQSAYIPIGEKHRLSNPGKLTLEIIEVQSGCYLGEDDIERLEDIYHRD